MLALPGKGLKMFCDFKYPIGQHNTASWA